MRSDEDPYLRDLRVSCCGLLMFGVPHDGLDQGMLPNIVRSQDWKNVNLINDLLPGSELLKLFQAQFLKAFKFRDEEKARIVCFFETKVTKTVEVCEHILG